MSRKNRPTTRSVQAPSNSQDHEVRTGKRERHRRRLNPQDRPSSAGIRIREPSPDDQPRKSTVGQSGPKRPGGDQGKSGCPRSGTLSPTPVVKNQAKPPRVGGHWKPVTEDELGPLLPGLRHPLTMEARHAVQPGFGIVKTILQIQKLWLSL